MMRTLKIIIHFLFWLVFGLFSLLINMAPHRELLSAIQHANSMYLVNFIWAMVVFYFSYFILTSFFERKQLVRYFFFSVALSVLASVFFFGIIKCFFVDFNVTDWSTTVPPVIGSFIIAQCGCLIKGFENWFANIQMKEQIEKEHLKNELELLKLQINPHFLFNTLNNIDSLIRKSPEDASEMLIKLSEMLRYMIYETQTAKVALKQEVDYLKRYVDLQRVRFTKEESVKFVVPQESAMSGLQIAPMLLIPLVENAFKHCSQAGPMPVIRITVSVDEDVLVFDCVNNCREKGATSQVVRAFAGIGLENVKKRLQLLYPNRFVLDIDNGMNTFSVKLIIRL